MGDVISIGGGKHRKDDSKVPNVMVVSINSEIVTHMFTSLMWGEFKQQAHLVTMQDMISVCTDIIRSTPEMQHEIIDPTSNSLILNPNAVLVGVRAAINEVLNKGT